jgi:Tfp pilus assembly protein PilF
MRFIKIAIMISSKQQQANQKIKYFSKKIEKNINDDEDVEEKSPYIKKPGAFSSAQDQISSINTKKQNKQKNSL